MKAKTRVSGGKQAAALIKARDPGFYVRIGRMGGLTPKTRPSGFAADREMASRAGIKGGLARGYKRRANRV